MENWAKKHYCFMCLVFVYVHLQFFIVCFFLSFLWPYWDVSSLCLAGHITFILSFTSSVSCLLVWVALRAFQFDLLELDIENVIDLLEERIRHWVLWVWLRRTRLILWIGIRLLLRLLTRWRLWLRLIRILLLWSWKNVSKMG